jgi:hypothetical protein
MITDALLQLSSAQTVTTSAVSTNTIDLSQNRDIGQGVDLYAVFTVDEAATASGAATVNFQVITSASANLSSPTVLGQTDAIPKTDLTLGRKPISVMIPSSVLLAQPIGQRYLGVQYTVATGPLTAGKFSCAIADADIGVGKNYPSGFTVV